MHFIFPPPPQSCVHWCYFQVFKCPEPEGVLRVTIVEARNLMQCDFGLFGRGQSDPYVMMIMMTMMMMMQVILAIGAKKFRSQTVKKNVNPVFGESWEAVVEIVKSQSLDIEVWDHDQVKMMTIMMMMMMMIRARMMTSWAGPGFQYK